MSRTAAAPPAMAGWNLALRFAIEVAALAGLATAGWAMGTGPFQVVATVAIPLAAAVAWSTFNVIDDPSRSGNAPIEVSGLTRLVVEFAVLGGGALGFVVAGHRDLGIIMAAIVALHYAASTPRLRWLLGR